MKECFSHFPLLSTSRCSLSLQKHSLLLLCSPCYQCYTLHATTAASAATTASATTTPCYSCTPCYQCYTLLATTAASAASTPCYSCAPCMILLLLLLSDNILLVFCYSCTHTLLPFLLSDNFLLYKRPALFVTHVFAMSRKCSCHCHCHCLANKQLFPPALWTVYCISCIVYCV